METMTDTDVLTRINTLKDKHEILKKELVDLLYSMEEKEKELLLIEEEYAKLIIKVV